jgi:hypothetical protein
VAAIAVAGVDHVGEDGDRSAVVDRSAALPHDDGRAPWVLYIGDGFASTGFRRTGDVERADLERGP